MMDWSAVALLFAERASIPAVLLSSQGEVLLVTPAVQRALGWSYDSVGSNWIDRWVAHSAAAGARWFLEKTLAGALRRFEIEILTSKGPAAASFEWVAMRAEGYCSCSRRWFQSRATRQPPTTTTRFARSRLGVSNLERSGHSAPSAAWGRASVTKFCMGAGARANRAHCGSQSAIRPLGRWCDHAEMQESTS